MKTRLIVLVFGMILACATKAVAADPDPWAPIRAGLDKYKSDGASGAVQGWIKGTYLEGSKEALAQANNLRQIEEFYGKYVDFHPVRRYAITPTAQICYFVMDYERGPLFEMFLVFKQKDRWSLVTFKFHTDCGVAWPSCIFATDKPEQ